MKDASTVNVDGENKHQLSLAEMPQHNHAVSATTSTHVHDHGDSDNSGSLDHVHSYWYYSGTDRCDDTSASRYFIRPSLGTASTNTQGANWNLNHNHGISNDSHGHTIYVSQSDRGSSAYHENRPPWVALAYIQRIA
jgi:microcystin-dependent protein